jgi:hypothetical protein
LGFSPSAQVVDQFPGFGEVGAKTVIIDLVELDSYPALAPNIGRPVVGPWEAGDESFLLSWLRRYQNRDMAVVVMITGEHRKNSFLGKEGRFSMRELFACPRQGQAKFADPL